MLPQILAKRNEKTFLSLTKYLDKPINFKKHSKFNEKLNNIQLLLLKIYKSSIRTGPIKFEKEFKVIHNDQMLILSNLEFMHLIFHFNIIADLVENVAYFEEVLFDGLINQLTSKIKATSTKEDQILNISKLLII